MNGKPPKFTSPWKTIPSPQFDAQRIYRTKLAPPPKATLMRPQCDPKATPGGRMKVECRMQNERKCEGKAGECRGDRIAVSRLGPENPRKVPGTGARLASQRKANGIRAQSNHWTS